MSFQIRGTISLARHIGLMISQPANVTYTSARMTMRSCQILDTSFTEKTARRFQTSAASGRTASMTRRAAWPRP
jgi:hypothetical protein